MAGFEHSTTRHGQLVINSVTLMGPATRVKNLQVLWSRSARGSSVVIPHANGRKSRRRRRDERSFQMEMEVRGARSMAGVVAANPWSQLDTTMIALEAIANPPTSGNDGHAATLTLRTGATRTANVFIEEWDVEPHPNHAPINIVTFDLVIPSGGFA